MASCPNDMFGFKKQHYTVGVNSQRQTLCGFFYYYFSFVKSARSSIRQIGKGLVTSHCILSSFSVLWLCSCMDENTNSFALLCAITTNLTLFYPVWDQLQQTERGTGANRPQPSHLFWLHFGKGFSGGAAALRQVLSRADAEWLCGRQLEAGRPSNGFRRSWYHGVCTGWVGKSIGNIHNIYELRSNTRQLGKGDAIAMCELCKLSQVWDRVCVKRERCRPESFA